MAGAYLSPKEAAAHYGVSESTIRRMIRDEQLEHVRLRGAIRIPLKLGAATEQQPTSDE